MALLEDSGDGRRTPAAGYGCRLAGARCGRASCHCGAWIFSWRSCSPADGNRIKMEGLPSRLIRRKRATWRIQRCRNPTCSKRGRSWLRLRTRCSLARSCASAALPRLIASTMERCYRVSAIASSEIEISRAETRAQNAARSAKLKMQRRPQLPLSRRLTPGAT
jgi:hypothetical protein